MRPRLPSKRGRIYPDPATSSNDFASYSAEVQCGQRVALIGIAVKQKGQSLVVGSAGASSCFSSLFIVRTSMKTANATMVKLTTELMNTP